ncbi:hypothetical protein [Streptomyces sp. SID9124]|uniref:hypothetical protein n=1 Tax=Streptomyces sp. SID9124 TaxID=2706108 RepID=UPI0013DFE6DC|nr:hypothetical protein [Streptomyces sp. SID9124]NED11784.1 hypothetical protein [Streptomyces sp. SID9124]
MAASMVGATRDRCQDLLVDDTWTTGNHVRSAATALKAAGARRVAVVVLGRHLNPSCRDTSDHVARARLWQFS